MTAPPPSGCPAGRDGFRSGHGIDGTATRPGDPDPFRKPIRDTRSLGIAMRKTTLFSLILLLLALVLSMLPADILIHSRLAIHSAWIQVRTLLLGDVSPVPDSALVEIPLRARIEELSHRLIQQESELARLRRQLRELDAFRETMPRRVFRSARVIAYSPDGLEHAFTIDRGRADGIGVGQAVVQGQALVGRVLEVGERAGLVLLVSSPGSVVPIRTSRSGKIGTLHGQGLGKAYAVFYESTADILEEEAVVTSGLLGLIPEGLVVGRIVGGVRPGAEPATLEADIELMADRTTLDHVLVIEAAGRGRGE